MFCFLLVQPEFWINPTQAILKAYDFTDKVVLQKAPVLGIGGSTAVTAILIDGRKLLVANVGDSRAVLCRAGEAIQLSVDHEPKSEKKAIEDRGGFVTTLPGNGFTYACDGNLFFFSVILDVAFASLWYFSGHLLVQQYTYLVHVLHVVIHSARPLHNGIQKFAADHRHMHFHAHSTQYILNADTVY
jgi:hypothetical protein